MYIYIYIYIYINIYIYIYSIFQRKICLTKVFNTYLGFGVNTTGITAPF